MAERQASGERAIRLEYRFDRLLPEKLTQIYELLVPERRGLADAPIRDAEVLDRENSRDLRACFLRSAEGKPYYR